MSSPQRSSYDRLDCYRHCALNRVQIFVCPDDVRRPENLGAERVPPDMIKIGIATLDPGVTLPTASPLSLEKVINGGWVRQAASFDLPLSGGLTVDTLDALADVLEWTFRQGAVAGRRDVRVRMRQALGLSPDMEGAPHRPRPRAPLPTLDELAARRAAGEDLHDGDDR